MSCSNTLAALVSLSPDSPTQMFTHNLRMRNVLITFLVLSFTSFFFVILASLSTFFTFGLGGGALPLAAGAAAAAAAAAPFGAFFGAFF